MGSVVDIIYATNSNIIRRIILPDDDTVMSAVGPGESLHRQSRSLPYDLASVQSTISALTGKPIPDARAAMVDPASQLVVGFCAADPELFSHPQFTIVKAGAADLNWKWDGTRLLPRFVTIVNNKVTGVQWALTQPAAVVGQTILQSGSASVGDTIVIIKAPSSGAVQL